MQDQDPATQQPPSDRRPGAIPGRQTHTFVLRTVVDVRGDLHGLVSEPGADDSWRASFTSLEQLMGVLNRRMQARSSGKVE
jgi:hypothetical protein